MFVASFPTMSLFYFVAAFFKKIQPNWALYLYPPGFALLGIYPLVHKSYGKFWLFVGLWSSIFGSCFAILIPTIQSHGLLPLPYNINPFRQTLGWNKLETALVQSGYNPNRDFLFSDKYQMTSLLSFYGPQQKRAYFFNLGGARKNQFSYWPGMEQEVGKTGYFVIGENKKGETSWYKKHYDEKLGPYFERVEFVLEEPLFEAGGETVKFAMIFRCINYNGKEPFTSVKY